MKSNFTKSSTTKSWIIANMRFWGIILTILFAGLSCLVDNTENVQMGATFEVLLIVLSAGFLLGMCEGKIETIIRDTAVLLNVLYLEPIAALFRTVDKINPSIIISFISLFILSMVIGWIIASYIYNNFDHFITRYYKNRTTEIDKHSLRLLMAYHGFVEATVFSYCTMGALVGIFFRIAYK